MKSIAISTEWNSDRELISTECNQTSGWLMGFISAPQKDGKEGGGKRKREKETKKKKQTEELELKIGLRANGCKVRLKTQKKRAFESIVIQKKKKQLK